LPAATGAEDAGRPGAAEGDAAATAGDGDGPAADGEAAAAGEGDAPAAPGEGPVAGCGWAALGADVGGGLVLPLHAASKPLPLSATATLALVSKWRRLMCMHLSA
jgi:hypothetical protein